MRQRPHHASYAALLTLVPAGALVIASISGCSGARSRVNEDRILQRAGLSSSERQPGTPADIESVRGETITVRAEPRESIADVRVLVGSPDSRPASVAQDASTAPVEQVPVSEASVPDGAAATRAPLAESGFIDAVVGQINGRPVYASEFFAPMDARLRSEAARLPPAQWMNQAAQLIEATLFERMKEELILAEFQSSLTTEQRQGLLSFVGNLRQRIVAENLGSESLATSRLEATEGLTLDQKIQQQRDTEIIRAQVTRAIGDRLYVSWREVELAYERDYDAYNPQPVARLRMIQVPAANAERVDEVRELLASGVPFAEVAAAKSDFRTEDGGLWTIALERGGYAETRIFAPDELNAVASTLSPGQVSEPFQWSSSTVWLTLEEIEQAPVRTLYEAQREIHDRLREQRINEEQSEYFVRLLGRASVTDFREMATRLLEIARHRYLQQPTPGAPGAPGAPGTSGAGAPTGAPRAPRR